MGAGVGSCLVRGLALLGGLRLERARDREPRDGVSLGSAGFPEPGGESLQGRAPAAQLKQRLCGCVLGVSRGWPQNLHQGPVQNESVGPLFKKSLRISRW